MRKTLYLLILVFVLTACNVPPNGQASPAPPGAGAPSSQPAAAPTQPPPAATAPATGQVWRHSPLGVALGEGSKRVDGFVTYIHDLGVPRTKVSYYWADLEPQPDQYDFSRLDAYLDQLGPDDQALLNLFTNGWCTTEKEVGSRKGAPLRDCPEGQTSCTKSCAEYYRDFVTKVTEEVRDHARGGIRYMQRDTEPASVRHFPADKPQAYVELQHIFYQAVKAVLPDVLVIGVNHNSNFTNHDMGVPTSRGFFEYVLQHGKDDFDLLDLRLYGDIYAIPHRVAWFREHMQAYGYQKPIVSTEYGGPDPHTLHNGKKYLFTAQLKIIRDQCEGENLRCAHRWAVQHTEQVDPKLRPFFRVATDEEQAQYEQIHCYDIVQRSVTILGAGVQAEWMWNLQSPGTDLIFGQMRLRTPQMEELPGYACYKRFAGHMGNTTKVERVDVPDKSIYLYRVEREDQQPLFIAWRHTDGLDPYDDAAAPPSTALLPCPFAQASVTDALGNPVQVSIANGTLTVSLGNAPLFIEPKQ